MQQRADSKGKLMTSRNVIPQSLRPFSRSSAIKLNDKKDYFREFKNSLNSILMNHQTKKPALKVEKPAPQNGKPQNCEQAKNGPAAKLANASSQNGAKAPRPAASLSQIQTTFGKKSKSAASLKNSPVGLFDNYYKRPPRPASNFNSTSRPHGSLERPLPANTKENRPQQNPADPKHRNLPPKQQHKDLSTATSNSFFKTAFRNKDGHARSMPKLGLTAANTQPTSLSRKRPAPYAQAAVGQQGGANAFAKNTYSNTSSGFSSFVTRVAEVKDQAHMTSINYAQNSKSGIAATKEAHYPRPYFFDDFVKAHTAPDAANHYHNLLRIHMSQTLQSLQMLSRLNLNNYLPNGKQLFMHDLISHSQVVERLETPAVLKPVRKTVIFDLDETLIHCNEDQAGPCDMRVPVVFPTGEKIMAGINIRPFAKEVLEELAQHFEVLIFTASHSCYANPVVDYFDEKKIISGRLFREHCSQVIDGLFTKDLSVIKNRDLKNLILIDNASYSFILNLENGVPIIPYYNNKQDTELLKLKSFLLDLKDTPDVRPHIKKYFEWDSFNQLSNRPERLFKKLFG